MRQVSSTMEDGFMKTWQECCDHFNVDTERGLSTDQVEKNLKKYGANGKKDYDILGFQWKDRFVGQLEDFWAIKLQCIFCFIIA